MVPYQKTPKGGVISPGTGITGSCDPQEWLLETESKSCRAPVPEVTFLFFNFFRFRGFSPSWWLGGGGDDDDDGEQGIWSGSADGVRVHHVVSYAK
jgi:hypothetical protein